jgi:hypothetical protein
MKTNGPKYKILVLHALRGNARQTTIDHVYCYPQYKPGNLYAFHHIYAPLSEEIRSFPFDAIVINYCFLHQRVTSLYEELKTERYAFVAQSAARKIAISQDEITQNETLDEWLDYMNVDVIFTPVTKNLDVLFPICSSRIKIRHAFAGYSQTGDVKRLDLFNRPFRERSIDLGTRVRITPPHYGRAGILKGRAAENLRDLAREAGVVTDISTRPEDAFIGDDWFRFLGSCRFTLVARGGASVCDPRGEIKRKVEEFLKSQPDAAFEAVEAACFAGQDRYDFTAVTPRLFEAAALRTGLVLLEDDYVAGLEPYRHYIPLKADFSNLDEVFGLLRDDTRAEAMIEAAFQHLVASGVFSYSTFVDDVFSEIEAAYPVPRPASPADYANLQNHYRRLAAYQRLVMDAPPHWSQVARHAGFRAQMLGQRDSLLGLIEAKRRGSGARSGMAAEIEGGGRLDPTLAGVAIEAISRLGDDQGDLNALASLIAGDPQMGWGLDYRRHYGHCEYIYDRLPDRDGPGHDE